MRASSSEFKRASKAHQAHKVVGALGAEWMLCASLRGRDPVESGSPVAWAQVMREADDGTAA
jgi:hypothetical protein